MRVAVDVFALAGEPSVQVQYDHVLGMMLRPGFIEVGLQRSAMRRVTFQTGETRVWLQSERTTLSAEPRIDTP